jgi:uroporphyrinogen III methyltransferase/synthase
MTLDKGIVYLVGAGPGDYRLITLRGLECIQEADVIVYDRLANPVLLNHAHQDSELIYVGKLPERHAMKQDEINELLVEKASEGKSVVRLKGGDPFVFGRGGEEAEFLRSRNVDFEVVPGISSAIAAPAYAGIPLTHRDMASSFAVITGHEAEGKDELDAAKWHSLASSCDTLVFLMGMGNLPKIVSNLVKQGRESHEPVALIQWGTTIDQRCLMGDLSDIVEKAKRENFSSPTVIVIGKVASLGNKLSWFGGKPLSGKRVMITRPSHQARGMTNLIEGLGGEPWEFPTIEIAPPSDFSPVDNAIERIEEYSWLVFTSINGVTAFFERMIHLRKDIRCLKDIHISAIGTKTEAELKKMGLFCAYVPEEYTSEALAAGLKRKLKQGDRILIPRAETAPDVFGDLRDAGMEVDEVPAYRTVPGSGNIHLARKLLEDGKIHILTFTSASTVTNFVDMIGTDDLGELLQGVVVSCIGPVTARTAKDLGLPVQVVADKHTIEGMVNSILTYTNEM